MTEGVCERVSGKRNKFEDKLAERLALDPKRRRSGGMPQGSLTIRLNMPVMRRDHVWLDHSHKVGVTPFERVTQPNLSDLRQFRGSIRFQTRV